MLHPRPEVLAIAPYVGGESKASGHNRVVKLSSNEGAFGVPPAAQAAYAAAAGIRSSIGCVSVCAPISWRFDKAATCASLSRSGR